MKIAYLHERCARRGYQSRHLLPTCVRQRRRKHPAKAAFFAIIRPRPGADERVLGGSAPRASSLREHGKGIRFLRPHDARPVFMSDNPIRKGWRSPHCLAAHHQHPCQIAKCRASRSMSQAASTRGADQKVLSMISTENRLQRFAIMLGGCRRQYFSRSFSPNASRTAFSVIGSFA